MNDPLIPPPTPPVDRRQMLEDLKARKTTQTPVQEIAPTSRTTKKKSARPARAAKILVFGLSTTAMFGAVTGYALADMQKHHQPAPATPVMGQVPAPAAPAVAQAPTAAAPTDAATNVAQDPAASIPKKKAQPVEAPVAMETPAPVAPAVDQQAPVAVDSGTTNVVDVPVPSAAQAGQGQTSGGSQQSSGSH